MRIFLNIVKAVSALVSLAAFVLLMWGLFYLCIPNVRMWTDKTVFGAEVETAPSDIEEEKLEVIVSELGV